MSQGVSPFRRLMAGAGAAFATLAILFVLILGWGVWSFVGSGPASPDGQPTTVVLRSGAGLTEIGASLEEAGVVRSSALFAAAAQVMGAARDLKAGEYEFDSRSSMAGIIDKVRRGEVVRRAITIPEGVTSEMAVEILMAEPLLVGAAPVPPEGAILPETYEYRRGEDRGAVLSRMMDAQEKLLGELWAQRAPGLPIRTPQEAVTLASIVEKETGLAEERPRVARVFVNRLQQGMRLQSDPTIIYGVSKGRPLGRGIRASELAAQTPYNTYQIDGLPPTPIGNPGRAALAAVLAPPPGGDLYFVADGTGGHAFASTLEAHNANVERWRSIEKAKAAASPPSATEKK